jgi:hypothetical protein
MPSNYIGNPANNPTAIQLPSDGDGPLTVSDVNPGFEGLADKVEHTMRDRRPIPFGVWRNYRNLIGGSLPAGAVNTPLIMTPGGGTVFPLTASVALPSTMDATKLKVAFCLSLDIEIVAFVAGDNLQVHADALFGPGQAAAVAQEWVSNGGSVITGTARRTISMSGFLQGSIPPLSSPLITSVDVRMVLNRTLVAGSSNYAIYNASLSGFIVRDYV